VNAKTRQKHDYASAAWRRSYARRTGAERGFATAKDPATNDIARGWCRLMALPPLMLFNTVVLIVRNQRILAAWDARQADNARRAAAGLARAYSPIRAAVWVMDNAARTAPERGFCVRLSELGEQSAGAVVPRLWPDLRRGRR
jgi:hypothetical protein